MADNVGYTPGTGATVAADDIGGVLFQRIKPTIGEDGSAVDVSLSNPMPTVANQSDDLLRMLSRLVKILECNAVVDSSQRQRIAVDSFIATIPTLTTLTTCSTVSSVTNVAANAGMDREQYINIAKQTYTQSIRNRLEFV